MAERGPSTGWNTGERPSWAMGIAPLGTMSDFADAYTNLPDPTEEVCPQGQHRQGQEVVTDEDMELDEVPLVKKQKTTDEVE